MPACGAGGAAACIRAASLVTLAPACTTSRCPAQNKGDKDNGWTEDGWGTAVYNATSKNVELLPK